MVNHTDVPLKALKHLQKQSSQAKIRKILGRRRQKSKYRFHSKRKPKAEQNVSPRCRPHNRPRAEVHRNVSELYSLKPRMSASKRCAKWLANLPTQKKWSTGTTQSKMSINVMKPSAKRQPGKAKYDRNSMATSKSMSTTIARIRRRIARRAKAMAKKRRKAKRQLKRKSSTSQSPSRTARVSLHKSSHAIAKQMSKGPSKLCSSNQQIISNKGNVVRFNKKETDPVVPKNSAGICRSINKCVGGCVRPHNYDSCFPAGCSSNYCRPGCYTRPCEAPCRREYCRQCLKQKWESKVDKRPETKSTYQKKHRTGKFITKPMYKAKSSLGWAILQVITLLGRKKSYPLYILHVLRKKWGYPKLKLLTLNIALKWMERRKLLKSKIKKNKHYPKFVLATRGTDVLCKRKLKDARHQVGFKTLRRRVPRMMYRSKLPEAHCVSIKTQWREKMEKMGRL